MNNDIETATEEGFKVHKLPTRLHDQKTITEEIEEIFEWQH